jgi:hypothetical protein
VREAAAGNRSRKLGEGQARQHDQNRQQKQDPCFHERFTSAGKLNASSIKADHVVLVSPSKILQWFKKCQSAVARQSITGEIVEWYANIFISIEAALPFNQGK